MIDPIPGWSWDIRQSGILMQPHGAPGTSAIRYTERVRPVQRPLDAVLSLVTPVEYAITAVSEPTGFITAEGEYGSLVTVDGTLAGAPVQRTIGLVFADDFYSMTVGIALEREHFETIGRTVAEVARRDAHLLGVRRRRFMYQPPLEWHGICAGPYHAHWFPADFPMNGSMLSVHPALPAPGGGAQAETLLAMHLVEAGIAFDDIADPIPVSSRSRLSGRWWQAMAPDGTAHDYVFFEDDRYVYPLILTSPRGRRAANLSVLRKVLDSVEGIPRARQAQPVMSDVSSQWVD